MKIPPIAIAAALLGTAWMLATGMEVLRARAIPQSTTRAGGVAALLGDTRRMLARHFFTKADVYFHSGYYPSMFDIALRRRTEENAAQSNKPGQDRCESDFSGKPLDWIDAFGRNFYPSQHTHLGQGPRGKEQEKEILPWLRLSLQLSPDDIETYTVAAYWLDRQLHKPADAEQVLRDGLAANPGNPELLLELGRVVYGQGKDIPRARNLWESGWRRWQQLKAGNQNPEPLIAERLLASLAELEDRSGNLPQSLDWFVKLQPFSPHPELIQQSIDQLKARIALGSATGKTP